MKYLKHKNIGLLFALLLLAGFSQTALAQTYLWDKMTIGDPTSLINTDLVIKSTGELYLGSHSPRGLQTNKLSITGNYIGEEGSKVYFSVTDNSNMPDTRGYIDIVGTATKTTGATTIVLDMFENGNGWDGSCISLIRANKNGSDVGTFRMDDMSQLNGRIAVLRHREQDNDLVWYLAEKLIVGQHTDAQSICFSNSFNSLTVLTGLGNYSYQWYRCDADGSNFVNLGSANGAQTANYTPTAVAGTSFYRCVVTSLACDYNKDTTAVSGALTIGSSTRIISHPVGGFFPRDGFVTINLNVVAEGADLTYQWYKNGVAIPDETNSELMVTLTNETIDDYYVEISACDGILRSKTAPVGFCLDVIDQKRNHTLVVNNNPKPIIEGGNGGYEFVYYAWYKNNELLKSESGGEPGSFNKGGYYYTGGGDLNPNDGYYVILRDLLNREYQTCVYHPIIQILANVNAYPIPLTSSANYVVTVDAELNDKTALAGATIDVYNAAGAFLSRTLATGRFTQVNMPSVSGVYVLVFKSSEINKEIKVIVE